MSAWSAWKAGLERILFRHTPKGGDPAQGYHHDVSWRQGRVYPSACAWFNFAHGKQGQSGLNFKELLFLIFCIFLNFVPGWIEFNNGDRCKTARPRQENREHDLPRRAGLETHSNVLAKVTLDQYCGECLSMCARPFVQLWPDFTFSNYGNIHNFEWYLNVLLDLTKLEGKAKYGDQIAFQVNPQLTCRARCN